MYKNSKLTRSGMFRQRVYSRSILTDCPIVRSAKALYRSMIAGSTKTVFCGYRCYSRCCTVFSNAASEIGKLDTCETAQQLSWASHAKKCFGNDVSKWYPSTIKAIGNVLGWSSSSVKLILSHINEQCLIMSSFFN